MVCNDIMQERLDFSTNASGSVEYPFGKKNIKRKGKKYESYPILSNINLISKSLKTQRKKL